MPADKTNYGTRFLYVEDLVRDGKLHSPEMEIAGFHPRNTITAADKRKVDKPVIVFQGREEKMLALNTVNRRVLQLITGFNENQGEKWIGAKVKIAARIVDSFGEREAAVRILPPIGCSIRRNIRTRLGAEAKFAPGKGFYEDKK